MPDSPFYTAVKPGLNKIAEAFADTGETEQKARNIALLTNATIAQRMSQAVLNQDKLELQRRKAQEEAANRSPEARKKIVVNNLLAQGLNASPQMVDTANNYSSTGKWGADTPNLLPDEVAGPPTSSPAPAPEWAGSPIGKAMFRNLANFGILDNTGGKIDEFAKATGDFAKQDQTQQVLSGIQNGSLPLDTQNRIVTALSGKEYTPYSGGEYGSTNTATGDQNFNPIVQALNQAKTATEGTKQIQDIAAAQHYKDAIAAQMRGQNMTDARQRELAQITREQGGKPPPGYRFTADGNMQAIPGGPADTKLQGVFNQDTAALNSSQNNMDRLAAAANEVLNHPGLAGITGLRGSLPNIPGGSAADAEALLGTLKSQIGFGVLQDLRNNSKTGGALGAVSDAEGKRLEANLAALDKSQSIDQFKANLKKVIDFTQQSKDRLRNAYNLKHGSQVPQEQPAPSQKSVVRTGTLNGRKVVQYADGSTEYAD